MTELTIRLALWGKGLRVSQGTEEFQRLLPRDSRDLFGFENDLNDYPAWPRLMSDLHRQNSEGVLAERCVLLSAEYVTCISLALATDRYNRPSLLVLAGSFDVDWKAVDVEQRIHLGAGWLRAMTEEYARIFSTDHERLTKQLRDEKFLSSREFLVQESKPDPLDRWDLVFATVKKWSGIRGIGTSLLGRLGANTVLAREATRPAWNVEARIDGTTGELTPLSQNVKLWPAPLSAPTTVSHAPRETEDPVVAELRMLNRSVVRFVDLIEYAVRRFFGR